jgi:hypothetical protein
MKGQPSKTLSIRSLCQITALNAEEWLWRHSAEGHPTSRSGGNQTIHSYSSVGIVFLIFFNTGGNHFQRRAETKSKAMPPSQSVKGLVGTGPGMEARGCRSQCWSSSSHQAVAIPMLIAGALRKSSPRSCTESMRCPKTIYPWHMQLTIRRAGTAAQSAGSSSRAAP